MGTSKRTSFLAEDRTDRHVGSRHINLTYIVTVGTGKQLVAIYNVSFGRQILNWTVRDGHYIWRPTVSLYQLLLCKSRYSRRLTCTI